MTINGDEDTASVQQALGDLILDGDFERLEDLLVEFNLFEVLGIARRERRHSEFLAWLLDPRGSHGLRDYFLRGFLTQAAQEALRCDLKYFDFSPLDVDNWDLNNVEVATERHYIDILLIGESDGFVCLIENKIGIGEHSDQLSRYFNTVRREYRNLRPFPVFLSPDGLQPDKKADLDRWVPFNYVKIADLVDRAVKTRGSTISASIIDFLDQYTRSLRRNVLDDTDNIDQLAYRLYTNHRAAVERIINAKSFPVNMIDAIVRDAVQQHATNLEHDSNNPGNNCIRFFSKDLEGIRSLKKGERWTPSKRIALFEFIFNSNGLILYLMLGPGPEDTRRRLYKHTRNNDRKFKKGHFAIYRKPVLSKDEYHQFDPEEARPKVERVIREFYESDYWRLVNDIRNEFGLKTVASAV